jgi:hypothetical protein
MIINSDRENPLGPLLSDDVSVKKVLYFWRFGQASSRLDGLILEIVFKDSAAQPYAVAAYIDVLPGHQS